MIEGCQMSLVLNPSGVLVAWNLTWKRAKSRAAYLTRRFSRKYIAVRTVGDDDGVYSR